MKIAIRPANEDDISAITDLGALLADYHHELDSFWSTGEEMKKIFPEYIKKQLQIDSKLWVVAEVDGLIVGYMVGEIMETNPVISERRLGYLTHAYVLPQFRRLGVTKRIITFILEWFKQNKIKTVELSVLIDNSLGRKCWESFGFVDHIVRGKMNI